MPHARHLPDLMIQSFGMAHSQVAYISQTARVATGPFGFAGARFVQGWVIGIGICRAQKINYIPLSIGFLIGRSAALLRINRRPRPTIFPTVEVGATRAFEGGETTLWRRTVIVEVQVGRRICDDVTNFESSI